jgi:Anion-transporting ATPase
MSLLEALAGRDLVVVTGKGGTGKTAVAAALGLACAGLGRRVLAVEADPREGLHQVLGGEPSGGTVVAVGKRLGFQNVSPRRVVDDIVRERLRFGPLIVRTLKSPIYEQFVEGAPGLKEMALLAHAQRVVAKGQADLVILDAPASGHGRALLQAPSLVADAVGGGPFGRLAKELAEWIAAPARVAVVAVALAEELPVQETLELETSLQAALGRGAAAVFANCLYPPVPPRHGPDDVVLALWRARREANEREMKRLQKVFAGRLVELPLLPLERGPTLATALAELLARAGVVR